MSRNAKILLGILGGIVGLCLCVVVVGYFALTRIGGGIINQMVVQDPQKVRAMAADIVDYELPPGYDQALAMNILVGKMLMFAESTDATNTTAIVRPVIILAQFPTDAQVDPEEVRLQIELGMRRAMRRQNVQLKPIKETTTTIRGATTALYTFEGVDDQGIQYKQLASGLFPGKNGQVMLLISGSAVNWNDQEIERFIRSIR